MDFSEFMEKIKEAVEDRLGTGVVMTEDTVRKNNGVVFRTLMIRKKEPEEVVEIVPNFRMDPLYEAFQNGEKDIGTIAGALCDAFMERCPDIRFDMSRFMDFDSVKDRIIYRLVSYEKNRDMLLDVPYKTCLDLAVVYYVFLGDVGDEAQGTILINNRHMGLWKTDLESIHALAEKNTPAIMKYRLRSMWDVLPFEKDDDASEPDVHGNADPFILSNQSGVGGASCILYPELLKGIADCWNRDLVILPSSIHETLLLPREDDMDAEQLNAIIREVNRECVASDEYLSDHAYLYVRTSGKLEAA